MASATGYTKKTRASTKICKRRTKGIQQAERVSDRTRIPAQQAKPLQDLIPKPKHQEENITLFVLGVGQKNVKLQGWMRKNRKQPTSLLVSHIREL